MLYWGRCSWSWLADKESVKQMKCLICGKQCGLLKVYHEECKALVYNAEAEINTILHKHQFGYLNDGKSEIISLVENDTLYKNYLMKQICDKSQIYNNEIVLQVEKKVSVSEQKNRCTMVRTGYKWNKQPVWNPSNDLLSENTEVVFTDKAIYFLFGETSMRYPYNKIVNMGFNRAEFMLPAQAYFDVKTTSPFPHRFFMWSKLEKEKARKLSLFLSCISGFKYME